ncbi:Transcriptional regulator, GntR family protein [Roseovarius sp. EC-HK134]|jgi:DNA-binding GntR family transcriptional regulator|uniref:GntR family transcriptional regulator n=1 Tax=Roseovarius TaxID=74030 RepID=UPI0001556EB2|nr:MULTISPECIES: GntR family transcriptional regulator [Roseovarius]MBS4010659.1 GntR family transcriptional regulator [Roseovarius sp.]AWZ20313.1 Transcriptional regulator, GntR family [Roseovarius sp. AK1035]EDM31053.1 transcriptional regulator, GntR family protein [Roseovarius sp. TM1035]MBW4974148.1 GntR family transcriptional regulator [Roseovarius mucosus]VVT05442.1 Transcriptional regulator, GntR family protein [Roseovarius sp. EC-SD190]
MTKIEITTWTSDAVILDLERAIHEHRLPPGTKLGEDELGDAYGISRTIVRAALLALSHRHLVELKRNRGAFVAQPSIREAREVFEARALLEPRTAHSAATRMTEMDLALLRTNICNEHAALDAGENGRALFLSGQFHIEIARIADQSTIETFISELISRSSLIIALYWRRRAALCETQAHHALLDAFANRDAALAEQLMKSHLLDLVASLDLRNVTQPPTSLREALQR